MAVARNEAAKRAQKKEFEDKLIFLKRKRLPSEFITRKIAERVEQQLKTNNTYLYDKVNERFKKDPTRRKIFVKGLDFMAKDQEMEMVFSQFGTVERLNLMRDQNNRSKGFGFIMFKTDYGARAAVAARSVTYKNREIKITAAVPEHLKAKRVGYGPGRGRGQFVPPGFGFRGGFGGLGWGYGYGAYGAVPFQQLGRGRGVGALWNQPLHNFYGAQNQLAAATAQAFPQPTLQTPMAVAAAGAPFSSTGNPTLAQGYPLAAYPPPLTQLQPTQLLDPTTQLLVPSTQQIASLGQMQQYAVAQSGLQPTSATAQPYQVYSSYP